MTEIEIPPFMADDAPLAEPTYDPAGVQVGDEVVVMAPLSARGWRTRPAVVTSKARVWAEFRDPAHTYGCTWRLRLDDQTDGDQKYPEYAVFFRTPAQQRFHEAVTAADEFLSEQGISTRLASRAWSSPEARIELARLVWPVRKNEKE